MTVIQLGEEGVLMTVQLTLEQCRVRNTDSRAGENLRITFDYPKNLTTSK